MCDYTKIPLPIFRQRNFTLNIQAYLNVFKAMHTVLCGIGIQVSHGILFCESKLSKFGIPVTGQTFLASKGQIFLSSFHPIFSHFDPPFSISFSPNISPVFSFTGQPFMRLTECNLEIKRLLFSLFFSRTFRLKES